jgi:hypothetical protein
VLVTSDKDFRAVHAKAAVLERANVEVILCKPQPTGLRPQVEYVVNRSPAWIDALEAQTPGCRLWVQRPRSFKIEGLGLKGWRP